MIRLEKPGHFILKLAKFTYPQPSTLQSKVICDRM